MSQSKKPKTIPFMSIETIRTTKQVKQADGSKTEEPMRMGFVKLLPQGASLADLKEYVAFNDLVIDTLNNAGVGDKVEFLEEPGRNKGDDPVMTVCQIVK